MTRKTTFSGGRTTKKFPKVAVSTRVRMRACSRYKNTSCINPFRNGSKICVGLHIERHVELSLVKSKRHAFSLAFTLQSIVQCKQQDGAAIGLIKHRHPIQFAVHCHSTCLHGRHVMLCSASICVVLRGRA